MTSPVRIVFAGFLIAVVGISATFVIGTMGDATGAVDGERIERQGAVFQGDGNFIRLDTASGTDQTVYKTTGYGVNLSGTADSYVESKADFNITDSDKWTVSVWGYVDAGQAAADMAAVSANGRATIAYNGSDNQWRGWYYDEGGRDSYQVNVSTSGDEVGNYTNVLLWHNGTHLRIYRNNTLGETKATTGDSIQSASVGVDNWDGRLEELRTFGEAIDASNRSAVFNSPVEQRPNASPTARAMFDQPDRGDQLLLYSGTGLDTSNVSYSAGFSEQIMDGPGVLVGQDYRWDEDGPLIAPIDGSELDDAPVAYASYDRGPVGSYSLIESWSSFADIMEAVFVALGLLALMVMWGRVRQ